MSQNVRNEGDRCPHRQPPPAARLLRVSQRLTNVALLHNAKLPSKLDALYVNILREEFPEIPLQSGPMVDDVELRVKIVHFGMVANKSVAPSLIYYAARHLLTHETGGSEWKALWRWFVWLVKKQLGVLKAPTERPSPRKIWR